MQVFKDVKRKTKVKILCWLKIETPIAQGLLINKRQVFKFRSRAKRGRRGTLPFVGFETVSSPQCDFRIGGQSRSGRRDG